jgi:uncharacterized protein (UPF0264 family)
VQLLVSVRSVAEAELALAGGADVIDAKEPAAGPLGPVAPDVLAGLDRSLARTVPLSAALGDVSGPEMAARLVAALPLGPREAPIYAKLALPGVPRSAWLEVLCAAERAAAAHAARPRIIVAVYADVCAPNDLFRVINAAVEGGVAGVLLDTATKDGRSLLNWLSAEILLRWAAAASTAGLLSGVAGSLGLAQLPVVAAAGADVIGVRGAVCEGGRNGTIDARRVEDLRRALLNADGLREIGARADRRTVPGTIG